MHAHVITYLRLMCTSGDAKVGRCRPMRKYVPESLHRRSREWHACCTYEYVSYIGIITSRVQSVPDCSAAARQFIDPAVV